MSILARIEHWAGTCPDRPVHISGGRTMTYGELWRRSSALATHLLLTQPCDRRPVVVRGHKEPDMLVAFLATVKAGRPYVPVDVSVPDERFSQIITASGAGLVWQVGDLPTAPQQRGPARERWVRPDDTFYIIYTSGSTGEPKGVQITEACLEDFVSWVLAEQSFGEGEVFLNQAPFSFDLSVMDLYCALTTGSTLFSLERPAVENPRTLFAVLEQSGVTTWVSTPSFATMCLAEPRFGRAMLPAVRRFLFCGETLPPDVAVRLLERFPGAEVWNTYGPTEATVATTSVKVAPDLPGRYPALPVGRPKPGTAVLVVDAEGRPLPEGERGEIIIAGPNVSTGYLNNPAQTAKAFFTHEGRRAYRTGDWGYYRDGLLFFEGRMDFQVKLHGYRIELGDIEHNLRALAGVKDAVVLPFVKDGAAQWLAAFVIADGRAEGGDFAAAQQLRGALGARVPAYMVPRKFVFLDAFPMTPNGKADRRRLAALLA